MNFLDHLALVKRLDALIRRKATGTPTQLAQRLEISRASLYRYIDDLKGLGAPIAYCYHRRSYLYEEEFFLSL